MHNSNHRIALLIEMKADFEKHLLVIGVIEHFLDACFTLVNVVVNFERSFKKDLPQSEKASPIDGDFEGGDRDSM